MLFRVFPPAVSLLACLAAAPPAVARTIEPPRVESGPLRAWSAPLRDSRLDRLPATLARARLRAAERAYYTPDGLPVRVETSDAYADTPANRANVQSFVDFLGSRLHGSELARLRMFIARLSQVERICGQGALGCYSSRYELMVVPGEDTPRGQAPIEFVATHELAHHIARNRRNDPWRAIDWGTKRWASYEGVCPGVLDARYFPGDQGRRYLANPGEAFAEAYALYHYRGAPWQFISSLRPNASAFAAIERDVRDPWRPPTERSFGGSLSPARPIHDRNFSVTLDGTLTLRLSGPRGTDFNFQVLVGRRLVTQTRGGGSRDTLRATICGTRRFRVRVRRAAGAGAFTVSSRNAG